MENNRVVKLEEGIQFAILNSKTKEFEYFEYVDGKLLGLRELVFEEDGNKFSVYRPTGFVYNLEYISEITNK